MPRTKVSCTFYPTIELNDRVRAIATAELRSKAAMLTVLVTEAVTAREVRARTAEQDSQRRNLLGA